MTYIKEELGILAHDIYNTVNLSHDKDESYIAFLHAVKRHAAKQLNLVDINETLV